jgi:hypothetical protein
MVGAFEPYQNDSRQELTTFGLAELPGVACQLSQPLCDVSSLFGLGQCLASLQAATQGFKANCIKMLGVSCCCMLCPMAHSQSCNSGTAKPAVWDCTIQWF